MKSTSFLWRLSTPLLLSAALFSPSSAAESDASYCVRAQRILAGTSLVGELEVHSNYDSFVESKPTSEPLRLHAFSSNEVAGSDGLFKTLSCKMRTSERLNAAYATGQEIAAQGDTSCDHVHREMLRTIRGSIPAAELKTPAFSIVVDEEERTYMGPSWLKEWPFDPVVKSPEGEVHLKSRALYAPNIWWMPLPERFLGNYYCHLVSPRYLEAILRGDVSP